MKIIFWTNTYDDGCNYISSNLSLQRISKCHDFYFMNSGTDSEYCVNKFYKGHIINCENDVSIKGKVLFDLLKLKSDYDILVRVDLDAIVFDLEKLKEIIRENLLGRHAVMGNVKKFRGMKRDKRKHQVSKPYRGIKYVRGGCHATSRSVIDSIDMMDDKKIGFDIPYAVSFRETGCDVIPKPIFEINSKYSYHRPVWHPTGKGLDKLETYMKNMNLYKDIVRE